MYKMRILSQGRYDDRGYSNEESIANLQLTKPVEINAFLTYNYGMDDDRFPLSFLTEGQGRNGVVDVKTVQWTWRTMGRMKFTDFVTHCAATGNVVFAGEIYIDRLAEAVPSAVLAKLPMIVAIKEA